MQKTTVYFLLSFFFLLSSPGIAEAKKVKEPDYKIQKTPKSLFLIKKKIDEGDFGEPTIYPHERQQRVIQDDPRLFSPFAKKL